MRKLSIVLFAIVLLCVIGCGTRYVVGHVVSKAHEPAHDTKWLMPVRCGYSNGIPIYTYIPMTNHIPDRWYLIVKDDHDNREYRIPVNQWVHDEAKEGDSFDGRPPPN